MSLRPTPGGHSSLPTRDNAIYRIANALTRLEKSPFPFELNEVTRAELATRATLVQSQQANDIRAILKTPPNPAAMQRLSANPVYNATMRTTCVATMMSAGHAPNALPGRAQANINCRILPGHSQEEVRQDLIRIFADPSLTVEYVDNAGEFRARAPIESPHLRHLSRKRYSRPFAKPCGQCGRALLFSLKWKPGPPTASSP